MDGRRLFFFFLFLLLTLSGQSQIQQGLWFSDSLFQKSFLNPAHFPQHGLTISFLSLYGEVGQNGPKYNDLIGSNDQGRTTLDAQNALRAAKGQNTYQSFLDLQSIGIGWSDGHQFFSFAHGFDLLGGIRYPKELLEIYANGNAPFIGQTVSIGPDFQLSLIHRFSLGYARSFDRLKLGFRFNYLLGIEDASVEKDQIELTTNEDIYQLEFNNDYLINTSSLLSINDLSDITFDFEGIDFLSLNTKNRGYAIDFGLEYNFQNNARLSLSLLDFGKISWNENVTNYHSEGEILYEGTDIIQVVRDTGEILLTDTLYNILQFEESNEQYNSELPLKIYAGYDHPLTDKVHLAYMYSLQSFRASKVHAFAISGSIQLNKNTTLGSNIMYRTDQVVNIGFQAKVGLGPFQIYGGIGNILGLFSPRSSGFTSAHFGLNLLL